MRYDQILNRLEPDAKYTFKTTTQEVMVKRGTDTPVIEYETVPILDSYDAIEWTDTIIAKPTETECADEWLVMQTELANDEIDAKRVQEYGSWQEQFDMIYWDEINGTNLWLDHITQVKADNPKI